MSNSIEVTGRWIHVSEGKPTKSDTLCAVVDPEGHAYMAWWRVIYGHGYWGYQDSTNWYAFMVDVEWWMEFPPLPPKKS